MSLRTGELERYLEIARKIAIAAGTEVLKLFRSADLLIENKGTTSLDPVTFADRLAERLIIDEIQKYFPDDGITGEEYGKIEGSSLVHWVIDPIDGTRAFISGIPAWTILIAVNDGTIPVIGVIYQPFTEELFYGSRNYAFYELKGKRKRIHARKCEGLSSSIMFSTHPEIGNELEYNQFKEINNKVMLTRYGFDCYAHAMLAMGLIDVVMEAGLKSYDIQAPQALIVAAGGNVTSWTGADPQFGGTFLATGDENIHEEILSLLASSRHR